MAEKNFPKNRKNNTKNQHNHALFYMAFILICALFSYAFLNNPSTDLTGYMVLEPGFKLSTEKLDSALIEELKAGEDQPKVVIILNKNSDMVEEINSNPDLTVTEQFESMNALALEVKDNTALVELSENPEVKKIILDYPVSAILDDSVPQIKANNLTFGNLTLDGAGETICIIDTGIDYTHLALGDCNPGLSPDSGEIELLETPIESAHPYTNSFDYTWIINKSGYENIAAHFVNLSLEGFSGGDTLDRVYVYDSEFNLLAIYKENLQDFWTPVASGDTLYVRLVSDPSIVNYGFFIDAVKNGSTNATLDWSACSKVIGGWDTYNNDANPKDDHGHGTHVAGIIASGNDTYRGVSKEAKLVAVKALSSYGSGYASDVLAGVEWCTKQAKNLNISIISMSLGCDGIGCVHHQNHCTDDLLSPAINSAREQNISVFIAAGNRGWSDGISNPACALGAIPVGGVDSSNNIRFNRGNLLKILAPAWLITSSTLSNSWSTWSGTSMATPHAAGATALLREYWALAYNLTPTPLQIESKLFLSGKIISDASSGLNFSLIDLAAALKPILAEEITLSGHNFSLNMSSDVPLSQAILVLNFYNLSNNLSDNYTLTSESETSFSITLNNLTNGNYSYQVLGQERGGQWGETAWNNFVINVSSEEPVNASENETFSVNIKLISPTKDYLNSNFGLNFSVNGSGLDHLDYILGRFNETINLSGIDSTFIEREINISGETDGELNFGLWVNDNLTLEHTFILDRIVPNLVQADAAYNNETLEFDVTVDFEELNLNSSLVYFSTNYSGGWINESMNDLGSNIFDFEMVINSTIFYQISAEDLAGNSRLSEIYNFTINIINSTSNDSANSTADNTTAAPESTNTGSSSSSSGGSSGGGGGGGSSSSASAAEGPSSPTTNENVVVSTAEEAQPVAAEPEPAVSEQSPASEPAVNLTAKISEPVLKKYAPALYVLGGILIVLLGVYAFFLWRKKGNNSDFE